MKQQFSANEVVAKNTPRDYLFDNLRAILIILVVFGHLLTSMRSASDVIKSIYFFVFFFHMPAMAFVSGYYSKNLEKIRSNAFVTIFIPFLILNVINYSYKILVIKETLSGFKFLLPYWGLWYLLVLFFWKFFLKDLVKIRFLLPLSFIFALVSGFSEEFSDYLALGRMICFLPFFLLGYYFTKEQVDKIRRVPKVIFLVVIAATAAISAYIAYNDIFKVEVLYLRRPYPEATQIKSMLFRLLVYVVAIAMTIAVINLTTAKKTFLSIIGTSTMTVYILHLFTIPILEKFEILKNQPYLYLLYSLFMTAVIVYHYTRPVVIRIYDAFMDRLTRLAIKSNKDNR
ncbi:MAG: acyltransferase family protein [Mobilitalea sp.]